MDTASRLGILAPQLAPLEAHRVDVLRALTTAVGVRVREDPAALLQHDGAASTPGVAGQSDVPGGMEIPGPHRASQRESRGGPGCASGRRVGDAPGPGSATRLGDQLLDADQPAAVVARGEVGDGLDPLEGVAHGVDREAPLGHQQQIDAEDAPLPVGVERLLLALCEGAAKAVPTAEIVDSVHPVSISCSDGRPDGRDPPRKAAAGCDPPEEMTMDTALHWLAAHDLAAALRSGRVSSREATDHCLERIDRLDGRLHSFVHVFAEEARSAAERADAELKRGDDRGPLHGIPIAVKDLVAVKGVATAAGTRVLRDHIAEEDACIVTRLRSAGAVILGTLNMTEGAFAAHHPDNEAPRNPWDPERWPGVSSSGSGVATASGLCYGALGTDTGGSIRFPSAVNGLVGLKPTYGRVPRHGVFPLADTLDHVGPITRSVRDAAHLLTVIAGYDRRDETSLHAPPPDPATALASGVRGLRMGLDLRYARALLDPTIVEPIMACAETFREAGADLKEVTLAGWEQTVADWVPLCAVECALAHAGLFPERAGEYGPELRTLLETGRGLAAVELARIQQARRRFTAGVDELFTEIDLLLCPTLGIPVPPRKPDTEDVQAVAQLTRFTAPFDFSGNPTLSLPCGFSDDGMPLSLQLVARRSEEAALYAAGIVFEAATDWHRRHPEL